MGASSSTQQNQDQGYNQHFSGAASHSSVGPDGQVHLSHETFTGHGQDGVIFGTGQTFNQVLPVVGSLGFDIVAILTVSMFAIMILKLKQHRKPKPKAKPMPMSVPQPAVDNENEENEPQELKAVTVV